MYQIKDFLEGWTLGGLGKWQEGWLVRLRNPRHATGPLMRGWLRLPEPLDVAAGIAAIIAGMNYRHCPASERAGPGPEESF